MSLVNRLYTQWPAFSDRKAKKLEYEQHICILKGKEEFVMVSPIFRKNIYVNVVDFLPQGETPIDFFNPDYENFPLTKQVIFLNATLKAGDCMYVPAYYYLQSRTLTEDQGETIMIVDQYESHSQFVDLFMDGLEVDIVEEE